MGKYLLNKETQKLELHFSKPEYQALSEDLKKEIKSTFLWSSRSGAWVSRSTNNHYWAEKIAQKLGLENGGFHGERLTFAEKLEAKAEKAEARAERMEQHATNAERRAESLQKEFNSFHGDIAFFTQPNINSSAGRAFTNYRNKVLARYQSGMEEYRKSEYFQSRAETARSTADMKQLKDPIYLHNRIKECNTAIKKLEQNTVYYEDQISRIKNGEVIKSWHTGEPLTVECLESCITETVEKMEYEIDKLAFMENKLDEVGGNTFSRDNIKPGYIVNIRHSGRRCEIISAGPVNVTYKILDGGAAGMVLTDPYAAIIEIVEAKEAKPLINNPYKIGDILCKHRPADDSIYQAYQVIKTTETGVKIQQIAVENGMPISGKFVSDKAMQKKIVKSKWSDFIGVYEGDWQLHKYQPEAKAV